MLSEREDVGLRLKQISDEIQRHGNNRLRCCGLTLTQFHVLVYLNHQQGGRSTQKDIEEKFGVSHPTVAGILKRLESKELVRTSVNEKDRRRNDVLLTSKGGEYASRFRIDCREMEKTLTEHLSEDECREFCRMLDVICANARKVNQAMESQEEGAENG